MLSPQERQIKESIVRLPFLEGRDALALIEHDLRTFINEVGTYTSSLEEFVNREENLVPLLNLKENELTYNLLIHMWRKYTPNDALSSVFDFDKVKTFCNKYHSYTGEVRKFVRECSVRPTPTRRISLPTCMFDSVGLDVEQTSATSSTVTMASRSQISIGTVISSSDFNPSRTPSPFIYYGSSSSTSSSSSASSILED